MKDRAQQNAILSQSYFLSLRLEGEETLAVFILRRFFRVK